MIGRLFVPGVRVAAQIARVQRLQASSNPLARRMAVLVRYRLARTWGVYLHPGARVGRIALGHPTGIVIGAGTVIEDGVTLYQHVTLGATGVGDAGYPVLKAGTVVYAGATILGPVTVGPNAVVGAHSLVLHDVPSGATVVGSPARPRGGPGKR